jgi:hypothetical protein
MPLPKHIKRFIFTLHRRHYGNLVIEKKIVHVVAVFNQGYQKTEEIW